MTSTNGYAGTTVAGVVEATNERGLKLNGEWLNVSKFKPLELPPVGARVSVLVDAKGFLTSVQVLEGVEKTPAVVSRNETITRLAVLKAAAETVFLGLDDGRRRLSNEPASLWITQKSYPQA